MKLLVISHTPHYHNNGSVVGWGPTVRELDVLAERFGNLVHLAMLHSGPPPASSMPYRSERVRFVPLSPSGGSRLADKLGILGVVPVYISSLMREIGTADVVQVRCPAGISLLALVVLVCRKRPVHRWFKYAGNWRPTGNRDPWSYRVQRWLLRKNFSRGPVTINGSWPGQAAHIHTFDNPCLTTEELLACRAAPKKTLKSPLRIVFAGRTEQAKGLDLALAVVNALRKSGVHCVLEVLGDGPDRPRFEAITREMGLEPYVRFHGWLSRDEMDTYYRDAHFILFPSQTEGWPKVLSEAMAWGVVPVAAAVASIPQVLAQVGCGRAVDAPDPEAYAAEIREYVRVPDRWRQESLNGREAAGRFTYTRYADGLEAMLKAAWPDFKIEENYEQ